MTLLRGAHRFRHGTARLAGCLRADWRLLVRAVVWRLAVPVLKYLLPLPVLVRFMDATRCGGAPKAAERSGPRIERVRRLLMEGGRLVISGNCLDRSLVIYRFLSEVGASPLLVMGVNHGTSGVSGHAWIEVNGHALADATTDSFVPILVFAAGGQARRIAR